MSESNDGSKQRALDLWQRRLLPFMAVSLAAMGIFFFVASLRQLQTFHDEARSQVLDLGWTSNMRWSDPADREYAQWRALVELEAHVITRRYEQVRALMLMRAWTRYVGFLTGMILALVGSVFVLGKLGSGESAQSKVGLEGLGVKAMADTPLPGVVLATLGSVLMGMTIVVPFEFNTRDAPAYLSPTRGLDLPPPGGLTDGMKISPKHAPTTDEASIFPAPTGSGKKQATPASSADAAEREPGGEPAE